MTNKTFFGWSILFLIIFIFGILNVITLAQETNSTNDTMVVEVNLVGFGNESSFEGVSIEVPDYVFLGNLTKNELLSEEVSIQINNTGSVPIRVTPQLVNSNENIFSYLFFRLQKTTSTNNTDLIKFYKIGNFSVDIAKPTTGSKAKKTVYMQLNLTDYPEAIDQDVIGHKADIVFLAMAQ